MPAETCWIRIAVLASFNLAVLCLSRPIAEMIGWGWHSFIANCLVIAPLFAVCLLAMITSHSLLVRTLTAIGGVVVTSVVESALVRCGHLHTPELWYIEREAAELFLYLVSACLLIRLFAGFMELSSSSDDKQRTQNRNRLSIAGLMIATTAFFVALVWKSEVDWRYEIRVWKIEPTVSEMPPTVSQIRVRNARELAIYAPVLSSIMLCGWWAGISRVRCLAVMVLAVALGAISRSSETARIVMGAAGFSLWTTHIAVNVFLTIPATHN